MALTWPFKDPDEVLDYMIDWSGRLGKVDTILASTWLFVQDDGMLDINSTSFTDATTTLWLSGGTLGTTYLITNRVNTSGGRTMDQTVKIKIIEK